MRKLENENVRKPEHLKNVYLSIYSFLRDRGREGEREGKKHQCVRDISIGCLSLAPTRDPVHNPGMCPDWEVNQRPFSLQASTQSTEPHQPGRNRKVLNASVRNREISSVEDGFDYGETGQEDSES